ncbi:TPA: helix-turn-helix transcriptional regulator [Yersinia enterocolitica]
MSLNEITPEQSFTPPTPEQRRSILADYGFIYDKRIRERECQDITSLSRTTRWQFENDGKFPPRCHFGRNSCAWLLSDVLWWVRNPPAVENVNNPHSRKSA